MVISPFAPSPYVLPDPKTFDDLDEHEGLVAIGADLSPQTLLDAYQKGLFPWFNEGDPICWWSPNPRCIIEPQHFTPHKTLVRTAKKNQYTLTLSGAFPEVIAACAAPRVYADSTWISPAIQAGYTALFGAGFAHSVEVWNTKNKLVGGLYGVQLGGAFFGESMFSRETDVSKLAFWFLMRLCAHSGFAWVDCQLENSHLMSLGAQLISRNDFLNDKLPTALQQPVPDWTPLKSLRLNSGALVEADLFRLNRTL